MAESTVKNHENLVFHINLNYSKYSITFLNNNFSYCYRHNIQNTTKIHRRFYGVFFLRFFYPQTKIVENVENCLIVLLKTLQNCGKLKNRKFHV